MTQSRLSRALALADLLPLTKPTDPATPGWGGADSDQLARELLKGGLSGLATALANVLLWMVEQERRVSNLETANAVEFIVSDGSDLGPGLQTVSLPALPTNADDERVVDAVVAKANARERTRATSFIQARAIGETSWLNEPHFAWFKKAYSYASGKTNAIPGLAAATPEQLYYVVTFMLRDLGLEVVDGKAVSLEPASPPSGDDLRVFHLTTELAALSKEAHEHAAARAALAEGRDAMRELANELVAANGRLAGEKSALEAELSQARADLTRLKEQQPYRDAEQLELGRRERDGEVAELRRLLDYREDQLRVADKSIAGIVAAKDEFEKLAAAAKRAQLQIAEMLGMVHETDGYRAWPANWEELIACVALTKKALVDSVTQEQHQEALAWGTRFRDKYHRGRREVRRLNAALRVGNLLARNQAANHIGYARSSNDNLEILRRQLAQKADAAQSLTAERDALKQQLHETTTDLAWERGWELYRKAAMGDVVEAARKFLDWFEGEGDAIDSTKLRDSLREALAALGLQQPKPDCDKIHEPASERAIVVGSVWRARRNGQQEWTVTSLQATFDEENPIELSRPSARHYIDESGLRDEFTWVSDPPAVSGDGVDQPLCRTEQEHAKRVRDDKRKAGDERAAREPELVRQCENCGGRAFASSLGPLSDAECENCGMIESADVSMPTR